MNSSLCCVSCLPRSSLLFHPPRPPAAALWVKAGDQAPATTSAEAAERGEEEQAADQHCCNSGSRGNESKGT